MCPWATPCPLGHYRPRVAIHVSPLAHDGMSIGDKWAPFGMGEMNKESSFKLLDAYFDAGGEVKQKNLYMGNNIKAMKLGLEESLKCLRTTYMIESIMDGLPHLHLVAAGFIIKANEYAKANGKTLFENIIQRLIGMTLTLWNVLATGRIRTDAEEERRKSSGELGRHALGPRRQRTTDEKRLCAALEVVANQVGVTVKHITAVAIAYTMAKASFMYPIIGGRKVEHLMANIEALDISLTPEHLAYIDGILPFGEGFQLISLQAEYGGPYPFLMSFYAAYDRQPLLPPVAPVSQ
ncbi:NADP-dependent oxidoreductase domain-containing protein [Mycena capillaripes]|nr:NADP-dependent oxidoreductase domain-containing protein [Mycena capillaripes]